MSQPGRLACIELPHWSLLKAILLMRKDNKLRKQIWKLLHLMKLFRRGDMLNQQAITILLSLDLMMYSCSATPQEQLEIQRVLKLLTKWWYNAQQQSKHALNKFLMKTIFSFLIYLLLIALSNAFKGAQQSMAWR